MKKIINKKSEKFLEKYLNNPSPTGFESGGQKLWAEYIKPYVDELHLDNYGTCYAIIRGKSRYKVAIEAHADEIGYYVNHITSNGMIYVSRNGGSDHQIAPSKRVHIHTRKNGIKDGIFGWPAIHMRKGGNEQTPTMENIFIDVGASSKDEVLEMGIERGNVITYEDTFKILNDKYYVGRAIDNRIGGFMIAEVARILKEKEKELPYDLYIINSVQEEIGLRGAQMIANNINPDCAIITDVTHDTTTPMISQTTYSDISCGLGPVLPVSPAVHNILLELMRDAADEKNIPYQVSSAGAGGNDTTAFAYSGSGIPSAHIALPQRYMHTTNEMVAKEDVENIIRLFYQSLKKIKKNHNFKYFEI
jgi:putative aminopeptidase FrvX